MVSESRSKEYYDEFSGTYEDNRFHGYHAFIDDLEVDVARKHCSGLTLEAGCGTGLILRRLASYSRQAVGIDLSGGMLSVAQNRGLTVIQSTVETLPFPNETFDTVVSFKVLAHVHNINTD